MTRRAAIVLLLAALAASAGALVVSGRQRPSFLWRAEGEVLSCTTVVLPATAVTRTYRWPRIERFETAFAVDDPGLEVLSIRFDRLDYRIPHQSSRVVGDLEAYAADLNGLLERLRAGDADARLLRVAPSAVGLAVAVSIAGGCWVALFALLLRPARRTSEETP